MMEGMTPLAACREMADGSTPTRRAYAAIVRNSVMSCLVVVHDHVFECCG
jgi:hypothetical protein